MSAIEAVGISSETFCLRFMIGHEGSLFQSDAQLGF